MPTRLLSIDPARPDPTTITTAVGVLAHGGIVAFPTETFYGLGAAALDRQAIGRIAALKRRPSSVPLLVLVDGIAMAERIAEIPERARPLIARHWPGGLTLVFRARPGVPDELGGGRGTVGVRWSSHPVAQALVAALGAPITAPSANVAGAPPPTTAAETAVTFGDGVDLVLDGGETRGGLPSTVLDVTVDPPRTIRAGVVSV